MAKRTDNFKGNRNGFENNPQNINKSGANRKTWSAINAGLKKKGLPPVTKETFYELVSRLMNATDEDLNNIQANPEMPRWVKNLIVDLNDPKQRVKMMGEYRDWMYGKAAQKIEVEETVKTVKIIKNRKGEVIKKYLD